MSSTNELPALEQDRIDAMEQRIVTAHRGARTNRRRRLVAISGVAAGVLVLAAVVGPVVSNGGRLSSFGAGSAESGAVSADLPAVPYEFGSEDAPDSGSTDISGGPVAGTGTGTADAKSGATGASGSEAAATDGTAGREIIASASASVRVGDVVGALAQISATAASLGGYVESSDSSATGGFVDGSSMNTPASPSIDSGYITIRVPADRLIDAQNSLAALGEVTGSSTNRQDVTTQAVDLRARIEATQASVDRLQTLMAQAGSVADLLAAETQLADRQATLESFQQQLTALESQVSLSSLTVSLSVERPVQTAEPSGFFDGLVSGWNGLIASANGLLVGLGFLLPWLVVAGVVVAIVLAARRIRRRRPAETDKER